MRGVHGYRAPTRTPESMQHSGLWRSPNTRFGIKGFGFRVYEHRTPCGYRWRLGSSVVNVRDNYLKIVPALKTGAAIHPA